MRQINSLSMISSHMILSQKWFHLCGSRSRKARLAWAERRPSLDLTRLHFIDESGFTTNMVRRSGRCPAGQRLLAKAPHGHWRTTSFLAALHHDGIAAPMTLDGPMDGETFKAWTEQFLAPVLKPGDVVIMDNLSAHKAAGIRDAIEAQGAHLLYLPPYSPDLNPIEQVFAKFKALLRKAAARSVNTLSDEIANALRCFSPQECPAYLKHCAYSN